MEIIFHAVGKRRKKPVHIFKEKLFYAKLVYAHEKLAEAVRGLRLYG